MSKFTWQIQGGEVENLLDHLLKLRGLVTPEEQEAFLNPNWETQIHDPDLFNKMPAAVARVFAALEKGEKITIHGDYDADGVSGSSLLYKILRDICREMKFDFTVGAYLPDREKDGYGVAMHTVERLGAEGTKLLITVDCGIANVAEVAKAKELGMDVIICDHHQLAPTLPEGALILHPLAPGEIYPNKYLCGTGVAFKLGTALIREARKRGANFPDGYEKWFLDLVAIATVTDVMPLLGENRVLETFGLIVLQKTRHPGLKQIIELAQATPLDTQAIGFRIGPRLNAAGRIASARVAFDALTAEDEITAGPAAAELESLNKRRQGISDAAYKESLKILKDRAQDANSASINIVATDHWNPGIIGLIAGKLVTEFGRPAFAFAKVGEHYVGSGRSAGGMHLVEAMKACGDIFVKYGGHPEACGLTLAGPKELEKFMKKMSTFATKHFASSVADESTKSGPQMNIDAECPISKVNWEMLTQLDKMQPFGQKNPAPVFLARQTRIKKMDLIGRNSDHLRLQLDNGDPFGGISAIGFGLGEHGKNIQPGDRIDLVYRLEKNTWQGVDRLQIQIIDIQI